MTATEPLDDLVAKFLALGVVFGVGWMALVHGTYRYVDEFLQLTSPHPSNAMAGLLWMILGGTLLLVTVVGAYRAFGSDAEDYSSARQA